MFVRILNTIIFSCYISEYNNIFLLLLWLGLAILSRNIFHLKFIKLNDRLKDHILYKCFPIISTQLEMTKGCLRLGNEGWTG